MSNVKRDLLVDYIEEKIYPLTLSEKGKAKLAILLNRFNTEELYKAIDISFANYIKLDENGEYSSSSVNYFIEKIGGIAHNNSLPLIEQKNKAYNKYWSENIFLLG